METLSRTSSLCPKCLSIVGAEIFEQEGKVFISKTCKKHGTFRDLYWGDYALYKKAEKFAADGVKVENPTVQKANPICPKDCGLCRMHKSHTCLANLVLTNRCDLTCWYCFFYSGRVGYVYEPSLAQIEEMVKVLADEKPVRNNAIQLTGGEPLLRDDLVEIIKLCKKHGIEHVQLNTNGIALSKNPELVRKVREAGVNTLYLSFDGITPKTNPKNHWEIPYVFENCRKAGLGIVLVPTVVKGINDHELGDIVNFAFKNIDIVRSVNFQPVSLVGRLTQKEVEKHRITIPDCIKRIEEQTNGEITKEDFFPVPTAMKITNFVEAITKHREYSLSSHFACGMGTYVFRSGRKMIPISKFVDLYGLFDYLDKSADELKSGKNKYLVGAKMILKLNSLVDKKNAPKEFNFGKIIYNALVKHDYRALGDFHHKSLFIGMMHFMDLYNYDIERVKRCTIHYAMSDGRIIPFCAFNVIPEWYRDKHQKSQGISFSEWEKLTGRDMKDCLYRRNTRELASSEIYKKTYEGFI